MARTPLYKAAETEMIRRIESGEWELGKRLPNEFVLAEEFKVSQGTMRRALMTLEGMGLLSRKPGRGTLVAKPAGKQAAPKGGSGGTLTSGGASVAFEVHRAKSGLRGANDAEATLFGTGRLSHVERLLKRGGARAGVEDIAIPESIAPALDEDASLSFPDFLAAHGVQAASTTETVSADITTMSESVSLSCDRHTPLLVITRTASNDKGQTIARQVMRLIAGGLSYG
jgi:GntR family transcriptional regulator